MNVKSGVMDLVVVGLNHTSAPLAIRERAASTWDDARAVLDAVCRRPAVTGAIVVSTCNRYEVIATGIHAAAAASAVRDALRSASPPVFAEVTPHLFTLEGEAAAEHVFRVAASLESQLVGEVQVLAQFRAAVAAARAAGALDPLLAGTAARAVAAGRRARALLGPDWIGLGFAVAAAAGDARRAVVVGAGTAAEAAGAELSRRGVAVTFASRRRSAAEGLAQRAGGDAIDLGGVPGALSAAGVLVVATASRTHVFGRDWLAAATRDRDRELLVMDVGVPRNVDPAASDLPHVRLLNLDAIGTPDAATPREDAIAAAESLLARDVERWSAWWSASSASSLLRMLGEYAEAVRQDEITRSLRGLEEADPLVRRRLDALSRALVSKLMLHPIAYVRDHPDDLEAAEVLRRIFGPPR